MLFCKSIFFVSLQMKTLGIVVQWFSSRSLLSKSFVSSSSWSFNQREFPVHAFRGRARAPGRRRGQQPVCQRGCQNDGQRVVRRAPSAGHCHSQSQQYVHCVWQTQPCTLDCFVARACEAAIIACVEEIMSMLRLNVLLVSHVVGYWFTVAVRCTVWTVCQVPFHYVSSKTLKSIYCANKKIWI